MNPFLEIAEKNFSQLAHFLFAKLEKQEELSLNLFGEETLFVRFNASQVRQNTHVRQGTVDAELHLGPKTVKFSFPLTGDQLLDDEFALGQLELARLEAAQLPDDPFQVPFENRGISREVFAGKLLPLEQAAEKVSSLSQGQDFVGIYTGGPLVVANMNSKGQRHFFGTDSYHVDYSLFDGPRAVKNMVAGSEWNEEGFRSSVKYSATKLELLRRPIQDIKRGSYRVYMEPSAVVSLMTMFSWYGLSHGAYKRGQSPLRKFYEGKETLSPLFTLSENFNLGGAPRFNSAGEVSPAHLPLIEKGQKKNLLTSSRTAKEFGVEPNFAENSEGLRSPDMEAGDLAEKDVLQRLGTGLYLSNLHYLNWSDRMSARVTGMTRYACFWVEKGEIVGPIKDLRFDESLYRIFGSELEAVSVVREMFPDTSTYERRQVGVARVPGILLKDFTFTL